MTSSNGAHLLEARNLSKSFRIPGTFQRRLVVSDISFHVDPGEIVALLGKNGAGKTTTFRMTTGLIRPETGQVLLNGVDVGALPMYKRARLGLGYLSQEPSIFRSMSTENNIRAVLERTDLTKDAQATRLEQLLERFGLIQIRKSEAATLSGGERRRLEIARALVMEPTVILLDEPFSGVDPIAVSDIQTLIRELAESGIGILLTDHNVRETLATTNRTYIVEEGRVLTAGTPDEIVSNEAARKAYLGENFSL